MQTNRYLFGLVGYPVEHSLSQDYFKEFFAEQGIQARYENFPLRDISALPRLIRRHTDLRGLNVTFPHKQGIIPYLDKLDAAAEKMNAVNTVSIHDGTLTGYNTDWYGFEKSLHGWLGSDIRSALILGTGGAARAVRFAFDRLGIASRFVSRRTEAGVLTYDALAPEIIMASRCIVNATPVGMSPDIHSAPAIPYHALSGGHFVYDLIYNPEKTLFLKRAEENKAHIKNGLEMLRLQAARAWEIWKLHLEDAHGRS